MSFFAGVILNITKLLPNFLTVFRIVVIPVIVISLYFSDGSGFFYIIALIAFCFASLTDFMDGYLARLWKTQSDFGKFFDQIADKLIVSTTIIMLIHIDKISGIHIFPALIIICREILISGIREFMGNMKIEIPVTKLGKIKTTLQMLAIVLLVSSGSLIYMPSELTLLGEIMLWIAAILTIYSGYKYLLVPVRYVTNG